MISALSEIEVQIDLVGQGITQSRSQGQDRLGPFHSADFGNGVGVVFQELDGQPADRVFDDAHFFDGIGQVGNRRFDVSAVIDFGIDQVLGLRTGNGVEQFLRADVLAADEGHDNGAELFAQLLEVDLDAMRSAMSIMFRAMTMGRPSSTSCAARYKLRSRLDASRR